VDESHADDTTVITFVAPLVSPTSSIARGVEPDAFWGSPSAGAAGRTAVVPTARGTGEVDTALVVVGGVESVAGIVDPSVVDLGAGGTDRRADRSSPHPAITAASTKTTTPTRTAVALPTRHDTAAALPRTGSGSHRRRR